MGVYSRGKFKWIAYAIPKDMAAKFGVPRTVRESTGKGGTQEAERFLQGRLREVKNGTWQPNTSSGHSLTLASYAERWTARRVRLGLRSASRDEMRLRPFMERLGNRRLDGIKRTDVIAAVDDMRGAKGRRGSAIGKAYAPRTIIRHYGCLRALFRSALRDELVAINPCTLTSSAQEIPKEADRTDDWRDLAIFEREELVTLMTDGRVPEHRRAFYALTFFCGMRMGEAAGRPWRDYEPAAKPLGRMAIVDQHGGKPLKTGRSRACPVHPELATFLASWRERYAVVFGRKPKADDLIAPNQNGDIMKASSTHQMLLWDLDKLGLRRRRLHDFRRSFVSLAREDGARGELLKFVTHGRSKAIMDVYTTPTWPALCEQVACLKVSLRPAPKKRPRK